MYLKQNFSLFLSKLGHYSSLFILSHIDKSKFLDFHKKCEFFFFFLQMCLTGAFIKIQKDLDALHYPEK